MAERRIYDLARGKYGVIDGADEVVPAVAPRRDVESLTALILGAFATGAISAYLLGLYLIGG
ncbi:MAG: hypothetical protein IT299_04050 [Dehalococcoidia bacterium]|nr:hypothetical protein [Dehalococcoidia bacterium]